jgi:hypothetical protein
MALDRKSGIRDPANRVRCRTGISIRPTAFFITHQRYHERYCIYFYNFTSAAVLQHNVDCISRFNLDLDHVINATKSQAMVVNPRLLQLDDACQILLDGNTIDFHQKVRNLGLMMNIKLTWDDQISKICRNVFFTLKQLWPMSQFTPIQTRQKLVTSLIVPQFLYCDVIFSKSSARLRECLKWYFPL